jgi:hypothetical protein
MEYNDVTGINVYEHSITVCYTLHLFCSKINANRCMSYKHILSPKGEFSHAHAFHGNTVMCVGSNAE